MVRGVEEDDLRVWRVEVVKVNQGILSSCGTSAGVAGVVAVSAQQMAALAMVFFTTAAQHGPLGV